MSVVVASPPTSGWQELASRFASDSATLILRLVLFFILITIAGCGLRLNMRNSSSVSPPASARIRPTSPCDGMLKIKKSQCRTGPIILNLSHFASYSLWTRLSYTSLFCVSKPEVTTGVEKVPCVLMGLELQAQENIHRKGSTWTIYIQLAILYYQQQLEDIL